MTGVSAEDICWRRQLVNINGIGDGNISMAWRG